MLEQQTQTDTMDDDGHCGLDGMIITHQQEQALGQDQDTVSDDGIEEAAPSDLLFDDIFLLDSAVSMIDQLVPQIAAARNDRHSISDILSPPVQQGHAGTAGWHGVTHTPVPHADTLYNKSSQKHPANNNPDQVSLCPMT